MYTSQLCARICIQVPMLEVQAPNHITRKSGYANALKTLLNKQYSLSARPRQGLGSFDQVNQIAISVMKEDQAISGCFIGIAGQRDALRF